MKTFLAAAFVAFVGVFLLVQFGDATASVQEASRYFSADVIERGLRYSYERRWFYWGATFVHLVWLALLACTALGRRLTDRLHRLSGGRWLVTVLLVGACYFLAAEVLNLPFALGRFYHLRAWGMTERPVGAWFADHGKNLLVSGLTGGVVLVGLFLLLRWLPRWWWLPATALGGVLAIGYAYVMPVLIDPLFNRFTPLSDTPWACIESRVRGLIEEANLPVRDVLVMDASRQSHHTNAYFTGFGATRRIILYDNLLRNHPPDEVLSILAHEIGHWRHDHIAKGLALGLLGALAGFFLLAVTLQVSIGRGKLALSSCHDPAALFLILLLVALGSWLAQPIENAVSRSFERQADQVALELAKQPAAFIQAEKRLAADNLGNVAPLPFSVWMFATHPPAVERIRMAEEWQRGHGP